MDLLFFGALPTSSMPKNGASRPSGSLTHALPVPASTTALTAAMSVTGDSLRIRTAFIPPPP